LNQFAVHPLQGSTIGSSNHSFYESRIDAKIFEGKSWGDGPEFDLLSKTLYNKALGRGTMDTTTSPESWSEGSPNHTMNHAEGMGALLELRDMIASELDEPALTRDTSQRIFRPLTDGLGLESPKGELKASKKIEVTVHKEEPKVMSQPKERETFSSMMKETPEKAVADELPPPLPSASPLRKLMAIIVDQIFVGACCIVALAVVLRLFSASVSEFGIGNLKDSGSLNLLAIAVAGYLGLWFAYLATCLGLLEMTFGMWVWGLRVTYGNKKEEGAFLKKTARVILSTFFYSTLAPVALLLFQKKNRNLIDVLSASQVYRTVV
jgi:uncharacterized RDD family membrane protein YckC